MFQLISLSGCLQAFLPVIAMPAYYFLRLHMYRRSDQAVRFQFRLLALSIVLPLALTGTVVQSYSARAVAMHALVGQGIGDVARLQLYAYCNNDGHRSAEQRHYDESFLHQDDIQLFDLSAGRALHLAPGEAIPCKLNLTAIVDKDKASGFSGDVAQNLQQGSFVAVFLSLMIAVLIAVSFFPHNKHRGEELRRRFKESFTKSTRT